MKFSELLAPAKDKQTAFTAVNSGCDALYIGASCFGARKKAGNSLQDIKEIVDYAHKFYVKVHVTINTILQDDELEDAKKLIKELYEIGVDAIIVQDMAILNMAIKGELPPILIHASTQCDNRTLEKVKFFDSVGVTRVILARELSLDKIKEICENTSAEIETFVHGALCVSYSGQCYMSAHIGGRSANRGECAQACRKKYSLVSENGDIIAKDKYLLSLRDFNASKHLESLVNSGVKSFKIEGRLKDENYVKNVVAYYRCELDKISQKTSSGRVFLDFEPDLNKSFNRGFTDYFLNGRNNGIYNFNTPKSVGEYIGKVIKVTDKWFEISTDKELSAQDGLYFQNGGCLVNRVDGKKIYPNKTDGIKIGMEIYRNSNVKFEKLLKNSKIKRQIAADLIFENDCLSATDENGNAVSINVLGEEPKNPEKMRENFISQISKTGEEDFYIKSFEINSDVPFMPVSEINKLRRTLFKNLMTERLKNYKRELQKPLDYVRFPKSEIDYRGNVHNLKAKEFYENCGCKVCEMSFESSNNKPANRELMRTKHCLKYAFNMCKSPEKLYLVDEKGVRYPLVFDCKNCEMVILEY